MSPHDIIEIPWQPGAHARRALVDALDRAGRPPINSAGRLKAEQQRAWDKFQNGTGSPADDPNRPDKFPLAHVRFVAADIDPTADRVRRLTAAGLERPYKHEPWHWQLPNIYTYPLVDALPSSTITTTEEDDMRIIYRQDTKEYFAIGEAGITHLVNKRAIDMLQYIGVPGGVALNQLGKNDYRQVVEAYGFDYNAVDALQPGQRLLADGRVVNAGHAPWPPVWS